MSHPAGASPAGPTHRRGTPWWLWLLLALVALALLLFGLTQCGGGDPAPGAGAGGASDPGASDRSSAQAPPSAPADPSSAEAGTLTADGTSLFPLAQAAGSDGELTGQVDKSVTGRAVLVQSVPSDEGFWVGPSEAERIWVQLTGTDESGYVVRQGDRVELTGRIVEHDPGFAGQVGVDPAEGADQLTRQAAHVEVAKSELQLSTR